MGAHALDRYASPEALAKVERAPLDVCKMVFAAGQTREGVIAIRGDCRERSLVRQRMAIIWAARTYTRHPLRPIGWALNRDGSRVQRAFQQADAAIKHDRELRRMCQALRNVIR